MGHLALFGHVNLDLIMQLPELPRPNTTVEITERRLLYGGTAGNIAAIAGSLGCPVKLASFVGQGFPGEYRGHLEALGVDTTELIEKHDYGTPTWWGFTDPKHDVMGVLDQGPMRDLEQFEDLDACLAGADIVHFATGRPRYYLRIAKKAQAQGIPIVADPGQELRFLYDARLLEDMLEAATYLIVNHHEMEQALEKLGYGEPTQLFDHNLDAIIETRGADGVHIHDEDGVVALGTAPLTGQVVDTTGAGDSFRAGWHTARHDGLDLVAAARWGVASAALTIQHVGGQTYLPKRDEVDALAARVPVKEST